MEQKDLMTILHQYTPETKVIILAKGKTARYSGVYRASWLPIISSPIEYMEEVHNLLDDSILLRIWLE